MPKAAKTSPLWERLISARSELTPPKSPNQEDIAAEIGVGQTAVSGWKTGDKEPALKNARKLAKGADICVEYLYSGLGPRRPWGNVSTLLGRLVEVWEHLSATEQGLLLAYAELLNRAADRHESLPATPRQKLLAKPSH